MCGASGVPINLGAAADEMSSSRKSTYTTIPCTAQETPSDAHAAAAIYKTQDAGHFGELPERQNGNDHPINLS